MANPKKIKKINRMIRLRFGRTFYNLANKPVMHEGKLMNPVRLMKRDLLKFPESLWMSRLMFLKELFGQILAAKTSSDSSQQPSQTPQTPSDQSPAATKP